MASKTVKLYEKTRVYLNKARAHLILENPERQKLTDDKVIRESLKRLIK